MNSPLQKLRPVTDAPINPIQERLDILEQRYQAGEFDGLNEYGGSAQSDYEDMKEMLQKKLRALQGTSLEIGTIRLNVNPVEANIDSDGNLKFKDKGRGKNKVAGGGNAIKGGQVIISGEGINGKSVQSHCCNVESIIAIAQNAPAVLEYLARPHMSYRYCKQQLVEEGSLTPAELFNQ